MSLWPWRREPPIRRYTAIAKPEAFLRAVGQMTNEQLAELGERMVATGLTGREVVGAACARAGKWEFLELEAVE